MGYHTPQYTPLHRGFDTFFGFYNSHITYYDYEYSNQVNISFRIREKRGKKLLLLIFLSPSKNNSIKEKGKTSLFFSQNMTGYDMHRGDDPAHGIKREYVTDLFTKEAIKIIENHELPRPLYLQISHLAVHAPIEQPDDSTSSDESIQIREPNRRKYASKEKEKEKQLNWIFKNYFRITRPSKVICTQCVVIFRNGVEIRRIGWSYSSHVGGERNAEGLPNPVSHR